MTTFILQALGMSALAGACFGLACITFEVVTGVWDGLCIIMEELVP